MLKCFLLLFGLLLLMLMAFCLPGAGGQVMTPATQPAHVSPDTPLANVSASSSIDIRGRSPLLGGGPDRVTLVSDLGGICSAQIYSCRTRCGDQPRPACSCHHTCQIYGNCCEDYAEFCGDASRAVLGDALDASSQSLVEDLINSNDTTSGCLGGSFVITSCSPAFDDVYLTNTKNVLEESSNHRWLVHHMTVLKAQDFVSRCLHPEVAGADYLGEVPVTANGTGLQFRNLYCAVCSGFSAVQFWLGFGVCSPQSELEGAEDGESCDKPMVFFPREGAWNPCFQSSQLVSVELAGQEMDDANTAMEEDATQVDTHGEDRSTTEDDDGLEAAVVNRSSSAGQNQAEPSLAGLSERCELLTNYVQDMPKSDEVYKNIYCYKLHNQGKLPPRICEPIVRRLPVVLRGQYRTFSPEIRDWGSTVPAAPGHRNTSGVELHLVMTDGIEERLIFPLLGQPSFPSCDTTTSIIVNDQCLKVAFSLSVFLTFQYEQSSLIKGNYRESAESYTRFVSDTMTSPVSPRFFCEAIFTETNEVSGRQHEGEVQLRCVEISLPGVVSNVTSHSNLTGELQEPDQTPQTVNGQPVSDRRVRSYLDFATDGFHVIHAGTDVMKLPGTVEIRLCLTDMLRAETVLVSHQFHDYCASYKLRWHAQANIDGVVGEISLEGIITIICCILSDIGLLVRLALQQVVPFYNTYPAKIQFSLCLTLLLAYSLFLIGGMVDEGSRACRIISTMTHLAFLSALFWMNVTAFEIWRTFRHWRNQVRLKAVSLAVSLTLTASF
ncbi:hypothetical protein RRG08_011357 [Elysia crispata]|uniref:SMB domain-containing protein n=1 Tax=Elysia crispata TaxID=231223 RepID=A0AAE1CZ44_9GAST|nr:hypothetical protein RRG08_011357 [Elysia crispata]